MTVTRLVVSWGMCTVSKVTVSKMPTGKMPTGKVTMSRMVVTGMLEVIWSPGGCVPCGAAGQPATPQSGSDPQATNTFLANLANCHGLVIASLKHLI